MLTCAPGGAQKPESNDSPFSARKWMSVLGGDGEGAHPDSGKREPKDSFSSVASLVTNMKSWARRAHGEEGNEATGGDRTANVDAVPPADAAPAPAPPGSDPESPDTCSPGVDKQPPPVDPTPVAELLDGAKVPEAVAAAVTETATNLASPPPRTLDEVPEMDPHSPYHSRKVESRLSLGSPRSPRRATSAGGGGGKKRPASASAVDGYVVDPEKEYAPWPNLSTSDWKWFPKVFPQVSIPVDEYNCALNHVGFLIQGKVYVTATHLCFYSGVGAKMGLSQHKAVIAWADVSAITKANTFKVIPNAI